MSVVYIAGPMSGIARSNFPAFDAAQRLLEEEGYTVISPAACDRDLFPGHNWELGTPPGFSYKSVLSTDIQMLGGCDAVFMLPGWQSSPGATAEYYFAKAIGLPIHFLSQEDLTFPKSVV